MYAMKTTFGLYDEPELLPTDRISTAPELEQRFQLIIDHIDDALVEPNPWWGTVRIARHVQHTMLTNWLERVAEIHRPLWAPGAIEEFLAHQRDVKTVHLAELAEKSSEGAQRLNTNLNDIQRWLGVGLDKAAALAGISRGTVYAWRARGSSPRPATTTAVMRIHGLVAAAVKAVGDEPARRWFHTGEHSPLDEMLHAEGDSVLLGAVSARLRRELLRVPVPPPNRELAATVDDIVE